MTSYFSLFILMLSITLGMNVLAGAFQTSPAFNELGTTEERKLLFGQIGTEIPPNLLGAFQTGNVDCADNVVNGSQLLEDLCNPAKQRSFYDVP